MGEMPHAIMVCTPFQGHINPFVNLALKLASKDITITFVNLEYVHHKLGAAKHDKPTSEVDFFSEARESGLDIRYTTISDGFPLEFDRDVHFEEYWETMLRDFTSVMSEFLGKLMESDPNDVYFLVTDSVWHWTSEIAHKFNLLNISFWTEPAMIFSLYYHWDLLEQNAHFPCEDNAVEDINYIPGIDSISTKDLPSLFKKSEPSAIIIKYTRRAFKEVKKAHFILHNTVDELEPQTLSALNNYHHNYAIGPINFNENQLTNALSLSLWSESDCTRWLESKPPASVLYVSFGSFVHTNKKKMEEIAYGLLLSEVHFIWVIREGILGAGDYSQVLPNGFQDEIKDNGLIVPWCNQIMVLSNPAVGGFLTHNGWNSTVESMWCGVPMICYPVGYDQLTNRKLVVDDWKVGINLCDGECVDRKEVAEKIKCLMNAKSLRQQAFKMKAVLQNALKTNQGSSDRNFDQFMEDLKAKLHSV